VKRQTQPTKDPDLLAAPAALRRATRRAVRIAREKGTPAYGIRGGKLVDLTKLRVTRDG
jgi:hypothetical protein